MTARKFQDGEIVKLKYQGKLRWIGLNEIGTINNIHTFKNGNEFIDYTINDYNVSFKNHENLIITEKQLISAKPTKDKIITVDGIEYLLEKIPKIKWDGRPDSKGYHVFKLPENYRVGRYGSIGEFREYLKNSKRQRKLRNKINIKK